MPFSRVGRSKRVNTDAALDVNDRRVVESLIGRPVGSLRNATSEPGSDGHPAYSQKVNLTPSSTPTPPKKPPWSLDFTNALVSLTNTGKTLDQALEHIWNRGSTWYHENFVSPQQETMLAYLGDASNYKGGLPGVIMGLGALLYQKSGEWTINGDNPLQKTVGKGLSRLLMNDKTTAFIYGVANGFLEARGKEMGAYHDLSNSLSVLGENWVNRQTELTPEYRVQVSEEITKRIEAQPNWYERGKKFAHTLVESCLLPRDSLSVQTKRTPIYST